MSCTREACNRVMDGVEQTRDHTGRLMSLVEGELADSLAKGCSYCISTVILLVEQSPPSWPLVWGGLQSEFLTQLFKSLAKYASCWTAIYK